MAERAAKQSGNWEPGPEVRALWPDVSGNSVNGVGETESGRPRPVFWRLDGSTAHQPVQLYFYKRDRDNARIAASREFRHEVDAIEVSEIAPEPVEKPVGEWVELLRKAAIECGADEARICAYRSEWTYQDREHPKGKWAVMLAFQHDYEQMKGAPDENAYVEVMVQYGRAGKAAKRLANWIREQGYVAEAKTGPNTEDVLMIPAAIAAGLGELGKHGSMIHPEFGANFRLAMVTTDLPLAPDAPRVFGGDVFCESCQVCTRACPPDAISPVKQMVRGNRKWYVDFDRCVPYFVDNKTCGLCLAVCPWSRPGIAPNLLQKMAKRMAGKE